MTGNVRVLIVGYYGFENAGDEAILQAIVGDLKALRPKISFTAVSGNPEATGAKHGIDAVSWHDSLAIFDAVSEADLIIVGGGGLFHDYWGVNANHFLTNHQSGIALYAGPAVLAALLGKPVMLYAVGIGPLLSLQAKQLTRVTCQAASAITVRDEGSRRLLESIGIAGDRITVTADPVFGLTAPAATTASLAGLKKPLVAVCVRDWDIGVERDFWEREFAVGLDRFLGREGGTVLFVALGRLQGERENDLRVSERIQAAMRARESTLVIADDRNETELIQLLGQCDLTAAMRLHALIFSALSAVPTVAISYDPKVDSLMERIGSQDVIDIRSLEADGLARAMSAALARAEAFRGTVPEKLHEFAVLARQNAEIALNIVGHSHRGSGYWPAPELSSLLARGIRAQLQASHSLQSELDVLSRALAEVEADRDQGREFLTSENQAIARRVEELSSALALLQDDDDKLRAENETLGRFQQSQTEAIARIEEDRKALRKELEKARDFQSMQDESLSRIELDRTALRGELEKAGQLVAAQNESLAMIEADRVSLREELNESRQIHRNQENTIAKVEASRGHLLEEQNRLLHERDTLARSARESVMKTIRLETERESLSSELDSVRTKLGQSEDGLRAERDARGLADRELAASMASLRASELARETTANTIREYRGRFEHELNVLRSQRAWKVMLYLRRAYTLLVRRGWRGWLRFVRFADLGLEEYEVRFPDIGHVTAAASSLPAVMAIPEDRFRQAAPPEGFGPEQWNKYDLVILGIIDFDFRFQRPQQIAAQYARTGHRVFWISPSRFLPPPSEQPYEAVPLRENIWEIHLRGPQPDVYLGRLDPPAARALAVSLGCLFRDAAIAENLLLLQLPFWRQVGLAVREKFGSVLAYDCMDDWETFENMGVFNVLEEKNLAVESDVLVVTGKGLVDKFKARNIDCILVRNGSDFEFFSTARSTRLLADTPRPVVGYFGAIADWIDLELVREVAVMRPQYSFVLIGQVFGRDVSGLERLPNVYLLGNQRYELIPSFLSDFDACTIPFLLNQVTRATDPVKIYEYLSQGKPVVATDMAELAQCGDLIYIGKDPEDFARKVDAAVGENDSNLRQRRLEFARNNTWARRVEAIDIRVQQDFPLVSILIVTYNSAEFVAPCLDSIRDCTAYPAFEVIVVDNGSTDETPDILRKYAATQSRIRIELLGRNSGFAAGNNLAARQAAGEYLILLNVDTIVTSGWVKRLLRHVRLDPSIGIICPVTNFAGNEIKINIDYSDARQMQHFALKVAREQQGRTMDVDVVPLYCALIPRKVWIEVGELDEGFGIGMYEDDDFCLRIRNAGYRVTAAEDCFIHHFGQGSFSKMTTKEYQAVFEVNRKRFEDKWKTTWKPHRTRPDVRACL